MKTRGDRTVRIRVIGAGSVHYRFKILNLGLIDLMAYGYSLSPVRKFEVRFEIGSNGLEWTS